MLNSADHSIPLVWTLIGYLGTGCYLARLLQQWWLSEQAGRPVLTRGYWIFSVLGAAILFVYAVVIQSTVFILNFAVPLAIYLRQLVLHLRADRSDAAQGEARLCPHCGQPLPSASSGETLPPGHDSDA